jgi:hypothetical protein
LDPEPSGAGIETFDSEELEEEFTFTGAEAEAEGVVGGRGGGIIEPEIVTVFAKLLETMEESAEADVDAEA